MNINVNIVPTLKTVDHRCVAPSTVVPTSIFMLPKSEHAIGLFDKCSKMLENDYALYMTCTYKEMDPILKKNHSGFGQFWDLVATTCMMGCNSSCK